MNMTDLRIKIVQYMHGNWNYFALSENINRRYCERHGYDYVVASDQPRPDRHVSWHKVSVMLAELTDCDFLLYLDADCIFYGQEFTIENELLPFFEDSKLILVPQDIGSEKERWCVGSPCAGVILLRNCRETRELLGMWDGVSETHPEFCWEWPLEQAALRDVVFPKFWESIQVLDDYYLLQSRYGLYIRHYFLSSDEEREKAMRTYCETRGIVSGDHDVSSLRRRFEALPAYYGLDFKQVHRGRDRHIEIDGVKFLHPYHPSAGREAHYSLFDIVLASVLYRKITGAEDICGMIEPYFSEGPYEYGEVRIHESDIVFDCGANVGLFSAVASRYGAHVYAFEAAPRVANNWLSKTAAMNNRIDVHHNAVWDKEETLDFAFKEHHIGGSKCVELLADDDRDYERYQVRAITLDAFVEQQGLDRVDFIKADIEGAERNMLLGARNILKRFAPKLSLCIYHRHDDEQVLCDLILDANPDYVITKKYKKIYAYVP